MGFSRVNMMQEEGRKRTHRILIGVILATLPCYFCGIVTLYVASARTPDTFSLTQTAFAGSGTPLLSSTPGPSPTNTMTYTPGGPTVTLPYTPTQFVPATNTPTPTNTPTNTNTPTMTNTPRPNTRATQTADALLTQGAIGLTQTAVAGKATATTPPPTVTTPPPSTEPPTDPPTEPVTEPPTEPVTEAP